MKNFHGVTFSCVTYRFDDVIKMAAINEQLLSNISVTISILIYLSYNNVVELAILNTMIYYTCLLHIWFRSYGNLKSNMAVKIRSL
jgi:hypothetical protein